MKKNTQITIALILSVVSLGLSVFNLIQKPTGVQIDTPANFIKETAKNLGLKSKKYDQCLVDQNINAKIFADIEEAETLARVTNMAGLGTPLNVLITDKQVIPINGAYPYEAFALVIDEINEKGIVSAETLAQIETAEWDYAVVSIIRPFNAETDNYKGSENPSITLIEYSDFECPFCSRVHTTLDDVVANYQNLTWVYRHLPLSFHEQAMPTAIASECVAQEVGNEAFWSFADTIFANQKRLQK